MTDSKQVVWTKVEIELWNESEKVFEIIRTEFQRNK